MPLCLVLKELNTAVLEADKDQDVQVNMCCAGAGKAFLRGGADLKSTGEQ